MELPSVRTEEERERFQQGHLAWHEGALIQLDRALGWLTIDEREFIISGYTPEEWDALWVDDED
tara:strand:+ start:710 stop:901 length:192 start_codon:yes stop_codon:yes gene_type:complete